jgi:hypothetical protein
MIIVDYVASLLPALQRSQIEEDLRLLKEELGDGTLPPYDKATAYFDTVPFRSKPVLAYEKLFQREVKPPRQYGGFFVRSINKTLINTQSLLALLEQSMLTTFGKHTASGVITYSKANQLRLVELLYFTYRYARKLLLWTVYQEMSNASLIYGKPLNTVEEAWLVSHQRAFFKALTVLHLKPEELKHKLESIPDLEVIPEEAAVAEQTQSAQKLDVFSTQLIPIKLNPIYHIRMAVVEFQVARHQVAMEEARLLEYRLLVMKEALDGRRDAKLEQQIEYTENRLKKLKYKLKQFDEEDLD